MITTENKVYPSNALVLDEGRDTRWVFEPGEKEGELTYYLDMGEPDPNVRRGVLETDMDFLQLIGSIATTCAQRRDEFPELKPIVQLPEDVFGPAACELIRAAMANSTVYKDRNNDYWVVEVVEYSFTTGLYRNEMKYPTKYRGRRITSENGEVFIDEARVNVRNAISAHSGPVVEMTGRNDRLYHFVPGSDQARSDSCYGPRLVVGDRVIFAPSLDNIEWVSEDTIPFAAGTELVYVGRSRSTRYYGPWDHYALGGREPGLYEMDAEYLFGVPASGAGETDGPALPVNPGWLIPVNREAGKGRKNDDGVEVRVGGLPEMKFEMGDIVKPNGAMALKRGIEPGVFFEVERYHLDFNASPETAGDPAHLGACTVRAYREENGRKVSCYSTSFEESDLELVKRGNYYHWRRDPSKMEFMDLVEEANFYAGIGESVQVRNPVTGNYCAFTQEEAMAALKRGDGCSVRVAQPIFGFVGRAPEGVWLDVFQYPNHPELEARLRAETLRGFGCTV